MKNFKRVISMVIVAIFAAISFAGCALFERDVNYYNNLVVARVGSDIILTKKQLIEGYNSFGYQYVSSYGYSLKEAYNLTLDMLVNREIAAKLSANLLGFGEAENGLVKYEDMETGELKVAVTEYEAAQARKTAFDAVESSLREYEAKVREEKNWADKNAGSGETTTDEPTSDTDSEVTGIYTPYEKYLIKQGLSYKINMEKYRELPEMEYIYETNDEFIEYIDMPRGSTSIEKTIATEAKARLVRYLASSESGLGYSYDTDKEKNDAIKRELERIEVQQEKNLLVQRLQDYYEQGLTGIIDYETKKVYKPQDADGYDELMELRTVNFSAYETELAKNNVTFVSDLVRRAEAEYKSRVYSALDRYNRKLDTDSSYTSTLLAGLEGVYYVPSKIANKFFTVSHILISYSEEQKTRLTEIEEEYDSGAINDADRQNQIDALRSQVTTTRRVDGVETGSAMTAQEVLNYIENYVMPNSTTRTYQEKAQLFRDCIYMFNSDPGMDNPDYEYVIGADIRENQSASSTEEDTMSQMVTEFTAASRELFKYDKTQNRGTGTRGSMSGLVWTEYGVHIIMYTRNISDFIYTNTLELFEDSVDYYLHSTNTSYGEKTVFDAIIEELNTTAYSTYEEQVIAMYKGEYKTTLYKSRYKDLTKSSS